MTIKGQLARLVLAVVAVWGITAACTAALDFDKLNRVDAGEQDAGEDDGTKPPDGPRPDKATCVPDSPCKVVGQQGPCANGKTVCEGNVGTCQQVVQPAEEACDGQDSNCNGVPDEADEQAHGACGGTKYCDGAACVDGCVGPADCGNGNSCNPETHRCVCGTRDWGCSGEFQCVDGNCLCGGTLSCARGEGCSGGACTCGAKSNPGGRVCDQPNPRCLTDVCGCDSDSTCNASETCNNGDCTCGSASQPTGPFCELGECNPDTSSCEGIPPDLGPDLPPADLGPDGPAPDGVADGPSSDGKPADAKQSDTAADGPDPDGAQQPDLDSGGGKDG